MSQYTKSSKNQQNNDKMSNKTERHEGILFSHMYVVLSNPQLLMVIA